MKGRGGEKRVCSQKGAVSLKTAIEYQGYTPQTKNGRTLLTSPSLGGGKRGDLPGGGGGSRIFAERGKGRKSGGAATSCKSTSKRKRAAVHNPGLDGLKGRGGPKMSSGRIGEEGGAICRGGKGRGSVPIMPGAKSFPLGGTSSRKRRRESVGEEKTPTLTRGGRGSFPHKPFHKKKRLL